MSFHSSSQFIRRSASIGAFLLATVFTRTAIAQTADPFNGTERLRWLVHQNLSPTAVAVNTVVAAEETATNSPREYGPHWAGFGKRVGLVTANYGVKSVMEAGIGSIWGEDPRYDRTEGQGFRGRVGHAFKMTFFARDRQGNYMPAYARYLAIPGSSFLANSWMPDSDSNTAEALSRTGLSFAGRFASNVYKEFRPRH